MSGLPSWLRDYHLGDAPQAGPSGALRLMLFAMLSLRNVHRSTLFRIGQTPGPIFGQFVLEDPDRILILLRDALELAAALS
jgi:hypothetical protein